MGWRLDTGGGGEAIGFRLGPLQNVFTGADKAAAEAARDAYATNPANATWLPRYNADVSLNIRLEYSVSGTPTVTYQVRNAAGTLWLDNQSFEGVQGPAGADGTNLEFASESERDTFFSSRLDLLRTDLPIQVTVATETVSSQVWTGETNPSSYDANLWRVASIRSGTASFELDEIHTYSSGGENVFTTNEATGINYFPPWQYVGDHSRSDRRNVLSTPTARVYAGDNTAPPTPVEPGGPEAASGSTPFNVNFTIQTSSTSLFGIEYIPMEDYTGRLEYRVNELDSGGNITVYTQTREVVLSSGVSFLQWFNIPLELILGQEVNSTFFKADGSVLSVRPEAGNVNRPYSTSHIRLFSDQPMIVSTSAADQLSSIVVAGDNVTITEDVSNNTLTVAASASGEDNVQSDWNESDNTSDAFILNKPTIPTPRTDEEIRDVSYAGMVGGNGINVTVDDVANTVTISAGGGPPTGQEDFYHGLSSSDNPATVVLSTLTEVEVDTGSGLTFDFTIPSATLNDYVILLVPTDHDISTLVNSDTGFSVLGSYTRTGDVRTIDGDSYDSYTLGPLVAGFTANYRATLA